MFYAKEHKIGVKTMLLSTMVATNTLGKEEARPKGALPPSPLSWGHCAVLAVTFRAQLHHLAPEVC